MKFVQCKSIVRARRLCPHAIKIVAVDGGFMAFYSWYNFETWKAQR